MSFEKIIEAIVNEFGNNNYNVRKVAIHELEYMCEAGVYVWDFEMYNKKITITREVSKSVNEEINERWNYEVTEI